MQVLSQNNYGIQAIAVEKNNTQFWGTQYHPEYNIDYMAKMLLSRRLY